MGWIANQYDQFQKNFQFGYGARLLSKLEGITCLEGKSIADLGCGTGDLSLLLSEKAGPSSRVVAVDRDPQMLAVLREKQGSEYLDIVDNDIIGWLKSADEPFDVIFSNAALHWQPSHSDLDAVFAGCRNKLRRGGQIALQFSLRGNLEAGKQFLESALRDYLGQPGLTLWRSIFEFDQCRKLLEDNHFGLKHAQDLVDKLSGNRDLGFEWMISSQPNLDYLDEKELESFRDFLRERWIAHPVDISCHRAIFIATAI